MPAGAINAVQPVQGQYDTLVTITGTNLLGYGNQLSAVTLVGISVLQVVSASDTSVIVRANLSNTAQQGDVVLTNNLGATVVLADGLAKNSMTNGLWTYVAPAVITSVSPSAGQGNTRVTIIGTGLYLSLIHI